MTQRVKNGVVHARPLFPLLESTECMLGLWQEKLDVHSCHERSRSSCDDSSHSLVMCERNELHSAAGDSPWVHRGPVGGSSHAWPWRVTSQHPLLELGHLWSESQAEGNYATDFSASIGLCHGVVIKQEYDLLILANILYFIPIV